MVEFMAGPAPWFDERSEVKPEGEQQKQEALLTAAKNTLHQKLREIEQRDDAPKVEEGTMIEKTGTRLEEVEIELLADLLTKMLKYDPRTGSLWRKCCDIHGLHTADYS
jgi:serine/threonine-protein kinase SRPK3